MTKLTGDADRAAVSFDDRLGDGQAHASTLHEIAMVFSSIKLVEDESLLIFFDARPVVGHADMKHGVKQFGRYRYRTARRGISVRIFNQANEDVSYSHEVRSRSRQIARNREPQWAISENTAARVDGGG